jgi:hypothetical protein
LRFHENRKRKNKMMKFLLATAAVTAISTTTVSAMDLPVPGLAFNTEVVGEYKVDAESASLVATPELSYSPMFAQGLTATAGIDLNVWNKADGFALDDQFEVLPEILLGVSYIPTGFDKLEVELGTSYDFEASERGEITLTTTFNF